MDDRREVVGLQIDGRVILRPRMAPTSEPVVHSLDYPPPPKSVPSACVLVSPLPLYHKPSVNVNVNTTAPSYQIPVCSPL